MEINNNSPKQTEVIVIGSGFAGLAAAIECKMNGGDVIVLEKMKAVGGNSIISDGGIAAPCTPEQQALGIHDSVDQMFEDMMTSGGGLNDPKITRVICENALDAFIWSKQILNVPYLARVDIFGGHRVPRCYSPDPLSGSTMILRMREKCEELGIRILLDVKVISFIQDATERVTGVRITSGNPDGDTLITATKGIIVASGGFSADMKFRMKYDSRTDETVQTTNKRSTSAEVLEACMSIGGATAHLDLIQMMPWTTNDETGYGIGGLFGDYIVSAYGLLIDTKTGTRFVNEQGNRKVVAEKILAIKNVIGIADSTSVLAAGWDLSKALAKGIVKSHPTLDNLAEYYGIPLPSLKKTISEYNLMVVKKHDDEFNKKIESWMNPLVLAPFYSMRINPKTHYSLGGVITDPETHVLDNQGKIIKGLYAAGEITGLTHGANRLGSCSVTECLVMGRIAGRKVLGL